MIDLQKDITLVLGIDAKTIEQLEISWPTWAKNRFQMWEWPWIIFYDPSQLTRDRMATLAEKMGKGNETMLVAWPPPDANPEYESQRERMLTGHVYVPAMHCRTKYHMKLDVDAIAHSPEPIWPDPEWFADNPSVIAPRWGYSKGVDWLGKLEDWGDLAMPKTQRLGCRDWPGYSPTVKRVGHSRWCSWLSFYSREFSQAAAKICRGSCGDFMLPVPSQDSTHWYIADRLKMTVKIAGQKGRGWNNHHRHDELRRQASLIMKDAPN